jgi:hypothetical protein
MSPVIGPIKIRTYPSVKQDPPKKPYPDNISHNSSFLHLLPPGKQLIIQELLTNQLSTFYYRLMGKKSSKTTPPLPPRIQHHKSPQHMEYATAARDCASKRVSRLTEHLVTSPTAGDTPRKLWSAIGDLRPLKLIAIMKKFRYNAKAIIGRDIYILFNIKNKETPKSYLGTIKGFNPKTYKHSITFRDGDEQNLFLPFRGHSVV